MGFKEVQRRREATHTLMLQLSPGAYTLDARLVVLRGVGKL